MAILLGPAGMGLIGIYDSIVVMVGTFAGMGIQMSGIRQTAEAVAVNDQKKVAQITITLRRVSIFFGIFGLILLILLSSPISLFTFGNTEHAFDIMLLSIIPLLLIVSGGQSALIQGMRRIGDLAKLSIIGALFGTVLSIPIVYIWGQKGIVPSLIAVAAMALLTSWWYARKIEIVRIRMGWAEIWTEASPLLKMGVVFMVTAIMTTGTIYLIRVLVVRQLGLDAAGLYQAAAALSMLYVGFILDAMGKDYYPRLTAVSHDNAKCNQLVNEQAEMGVLLAVPGILATLTFAPLIIHLFYSAKFIAAYEILRWQILGILLRVPCWPMAFTLVAKGKMNLYFWTELLANAVLISLTWSGIIYFGLPGTGMAFFGMYLLYWILIFSVVKRLTEFAWSTANVRLCLFTMPAIVIVFSAQYILPGLWYMVLGGAVTLAFGCYSIICLIKIFDTDGIRSIFAKIKRRFGFVSR
ncbi:MAG: O-antigen translocase [Sedimentisphaerales bacterium]|nr:O-antigen translocase [Sedimentisphaerales bacterium]